MNIQSALQDVIKATNSDLQHELIMKHLIYELHDKIVKSPLVTPNIKNAISAHFGYRDSSKLNVPYNLNAAQMYKTTPPPIYRKPVDVAQLKNTDMKDILILTTIYYLSDLNKFDYKLINEAANMGLSTENIITLLLLNNIYDVKTLCEMNKIGGDALYRITTLKKLSALHKVQYNF